MHQDGQVNQDAVKKTSTGKKGINTEHGMFSSQLKLMCTERCFMYEECEFHTDEEPGLSKYGGICYFELDLEFTPEQLMQMDGLKKYLSYSLILLLQRAIRGQRYELATGGFCSEMAIDNMLRTIASLGMNMMQIYEKEDSADLAKKLEQVKKMMSEVKRKLQV